MILRILLNCVTQQIDRDKIEIEKNINAVNNLYTDRLNDLLIVKIFNSNILKTLSFTVSIY